MAQNGVQVEHKGQLLVRLLDCGQILTFAYLADSLIIVKHVILFMLKSKTLFV